jgi:hypothetical protein
LLPCLRADWSIATASRPPLYHNTASRVLRLRSQTPVCEGITSGLPIVLSLAPQTAQTLWPRLARQIDLAIRASGLGRVLVAEFRERVQESLGLTAALFPAHAAAALRDRLRGEARDDGQGIGAYRVLDRRISRPGHCSGLSTSATLTKRFSHRPSPKILRDDQSLPSPAGFTAPGQTGRMSPSDRG